MWRALLLCSTAACDATFGLVEVPLRDAPLGTEACWNPLRSDNEDSDRFEDGCDPCPADTTPEDATDRDGDSVGDPCDLELNGANVTREFDGFARVLGWEPQVGTWMLDSGFYVPDSLTEARSELTTPLADHPHVNAFFDTSGGSGAGVYMVIGAVGTVVECTHEPRGAPALDQLVLRVGGDVKMVDLDAGGPGRIHLGQGVDGVIFCIATRGPTTAGLVAAASAMGSTTTRIGLVSFTATTQFNSVMLYGLR